MAETDQTQPSEDGHGIDLTSSIEALLFVADQPVGVHQLAQALQTTQLKVQVELERIAAHYGERGLRLQHQNGLVQFVTAPEAAPCVQRFLGLDLGSKLSVAAMETLALIAYRQPATRAQIEAIRGVSCDGVLRTLLSRGLITALGRLDQAGRPIIYGTTMDFLQHFGLSDLGELPPIESTPGSAEGG